MKRNLMFSRIIFLLLWSPLLSLAQSNVQFVSLAKQVVSGPMTQGPVSFVARSSNELKKYLESLVQPTQSWSQMITSTRGKQLAGLIDSVDFRERMVLGAVVRGSSSLCTGISIVSVRTYPQEMRVDAIEYKPAPDTVCLAAIGAAYHLISVPKKDVPVRFFRRDA